MSKWIRKNKNTLIALVLAIFFGLYFLEIFPDPYHEGGNVNLYTWIQREIDELLHGEK